MATDTDALEGPLKKFIHNINEHSYGYMVQKCTWFTLWDQYPIKVAFEYFPIFMS